MERLIHFLSITSSHWNISRIMFNGILRNVITLNIQSSPTFHTSVSPDDDDDTRKFGRFLNASKLFSSLQLIIRSSVGFVYPIINWIYFNFNLDACSYIYIYI